MIALDHSWKPVYTNKKLEVNVILPDNYEVDGDLNEYILHINYSGMHLD